MRLIRLSFSIQDWTISNLEFEALNLIVAKNATGKSRTLMAIDLLINIITQRRGIVADYNVKLEFVNPNNDSISFEFMTSTTDTTVVNHEVIKLNGELILNRDTTTGSVSLKNSITQQHDIVNPPNNKLSLHTNRDVLKYPYLEDIVNWAEQSYIFRFAGVSPAPKLNTLDYAPLDILENIPFMFKSLSVESQASVRALINQMGYNIESIALQERGTELRLVLKEVGLDNEIVHYNLSQGMYRTLAMIIFINYLVSKRQPALVIIDDLCEGLDYQRATTLGQLIFDTCASSLVQLIATSNDSFLMDIIDLKYWTILQREGHTVSALNHKNSADLFRKFKLTGLSNFDLFSSDFIQQKQLH